MHAALCIVPALFAAPAAGMYRKEQRVVTADGWSLCLTRQLLPAEALRCRRLSPVVLVPGLGASGLDFSQLVEFLAERGWDVWTASLRGQLPGSPARLPMRHATQIAMPAPLARLPVFPAGMGRSDKPSLLAGRSVWWTIDHNVDEDLPVILHHVCNMTGRPQLHVIGGRPDEKVPVLCPMPSC